MASDDAGKDLAVHKDRLLRILLDALKRLTPHTKQLIRAVQEFAPPTQQLINIAENLGDDVKIIGRLAELQAEDVQKAILAGGLIDEIESALNVDPPARVTADEEEIGE